MKQLWKLADFLRDPYLVVSVQKYLGVDTEAYLKDCCYTNKVSNDSSHIKQSIQKSCQEFTPQSPEGIESDNAEDSNQCHKNVTVYVQRKLLYYLFLFGTALGDELFYSMFFSFWFWNVDGAVGRRVINVWALCMYIGQGLKDIIKWPRPSSPPVLRLETKWALEYGMPSTHAIVGAAVPFSIVFYTSTRYEYPVEIGIAVAIFWCSLVCVSRVYLGMHSVLDVVAGLALVASLFGVVIPLVDRIDTVFLQHELGSFLVMSTGILLAICAPGGDRWTLSRGDTMVILGSAVGIQVGSWLNFQTGVISGPSLDPPYIILWPSGSMIGFSFLRLILGLCVMVLTRIMVKPLLNVILKSVIDSELNISSSKTNRSKTKSVLRELVTKFLSYVAIGFSMVYLAPALFRYLGIQRPTFHTEV